MSDFQGDAVFWVDVEKVRPNPYQPRTEFDEENLKSLADSIRQYGVLNPLTVTRHEEEREDGGITTYYELIAGERRLRASKLAGLAQVPVVIRSKDEEDRVKLELAIIENLQREDLNAIDRARAFERLQKEFGLGPADIGRKVGKSREYVANSIRLLKLPEEIQQAVMRGSIAEGHARALLMLSDRPDEQKTVFRDILVRRLSVRDVEKMTREIAVEKARKRDLSPALMSLERAFSEHFGTRVEIKQEEKGGKIIIDFFSTEDLEAILAHSGYGTEPPEKFHEEFQPRRFNGTYPTVPVFATDDAPAPANEPSPLAPAVAAEPLPPGESEPQKPASTPRRDDEFSIEHFSV